MEILPVGPCGRTDGRVSVTKLLVAFLNILHAPKNLSQCQ